MPHLCATHPCARTYPECGVWSSQLERLPCTEGIQRSLFRHSSEQWSRLPGVIIQAHILEEEHSKPTRAEFNAYRCRPKDNAIARKAHAYSARSWLIHFRILKQFLHRPDADSTAETFHRSDATTYGKYFCWGRHKSPSHEVKHPLDLY